MDTGETIIAAVDRAQQCKVSRLDYLGHLKRIKVP